MFSFFPLELAICFVKAMNCEKKIENSLEASIVHTYLLPNVRLHNQESIKFDLARVFALLSQ
jgi:hypothetical protein